MLAVPGLLAGTLAGASLTPPANQVIVGSGSAAAYPLMTSIDDLFNGLPGCNLIAQGVTPQKLDFSCTPPSSPLSRGHGENWENDVATLEPPLGSSNAIDQLENQGTGSLPTAAISYAASSRAPKTLSDDNGLNFVAYARGGISWFHWTKVRGVSTPSAKITNLTSAQLQEIWKGQITNWDKVGGTNAPIDVYAAQAGSQDDSTWSSFLGFSDQSYILTKSASYYRTHIIVPGEDSAIIANKDEADAIFYFSYGSYVNSCKTVCGGSPVPGTTKSKPTGTALGEINGVAPSETTILNDTFPVAELLFNVYSNGSNPSIPPATAGTLNLVSEVGFLCKPNTYRSGGKTHPVLDPTTGIPVRTEIDQVITSHGFFPLPLQEEGQVPHPANLAGTPFDQFDPTGQSEYKGYCLVTSTDLGGASRRAGPERTQLRR